MIWLHFVRRLAFWSGVRGVDGHGWTAVNAPGELQRTSRRAG